MHQDLLLERYLTIKNKIKNCELAVVTKNIKAEEIIDFIKKTGHNFFAENYASELKKWEDIKKQFPDVKLSFIGSFQSGNIRNIVKFCERIETISSFKQFEKVKKEIEKKNKNIELYAQINIGREIQKTGFKPEEISSVFNKYFTGIMCIPPKKHSAIYFKKMQELAEKFQISKISMGMSADFEEAILCGSTEIRIGSLIFGKRK